MSTAAITSTETLPAQQRNRVLADRFGGTLAREIALVLAGTLVIVALAKVVIPLPFTPVPLSLGTLGVMTVGATLGMRRGALAAAGYMLLGLVGVPVFSGTNTGWAFASFGYIIGYIAVAGVLGALVQRRADRNVITMFGAALVSSAVVYVFGLAWMIPFTGMTLPAAFAAGVTPFLIGDAIKSAVIAGVFPALNILTDRR